jgi:molybdopterin-guanine dinucleotide biosynthesis protein A
LKTDFPTTLKGKKPNGLVLAGGRSTRMGTDKGLLVYNGTPQREHLFELLGEFCEQVYTSCRAEQAIPERLNPLPDKYDIAGPMNGVLTAFTQAPLSSWLIVAVDMPYVTKDTLRLLINSRDETKAATCFYNTERQHPEPLLALWEPLAYPLLMDFTRRGKVSPKEFLSTHPVRLIQAPDEKTLLNFNSPDDRLNQPR